MATKMSPSVMDQQRHFHTWGVSLSDGAHEKSLEDASTGDDQRSDEHPSSRRCSVSSEPCEELNGAAPTTTLGASFSGRSEAKGNVWGMDFDANLREKLAVHRGEKQFRTLSPLPRPSIKVLATALERAKQRNVRARAQSDGAETCKPDSKVKEHLRESSGLRAAQATPCEPRSSRSGGSQNIAEESIRRKLRDSSPKFKDSNSISSHSPRFAKSRDLPQFGARLPEEGDIVSGDGTGDAEFGVFAAVQTHYNLDADSDDSAPMSPATTERRDSGTAEWLASDNPYKEIEAYRSRLHEAEQELQQVAEVGQMLLNRNQELEALFQNMEADEGNQFWKRKVEYLEQEVAYQCQQLASAQEVEVVLREKMQDLEDEVQDLRSNTIKDRRKSYTEVVASTFSDTGKVQHDRHLSDEDVEQERVEQAIREVVNRNQALEEEVCRLELVVHHQKIREMELEAKIQEHDRRLAVEQLEEQAQREHELELEDLGVFI